MAKLSRETKQKNLIKNEFDKFNSLFTAEDLNAKLKNKGIGIATIYRFLKDLRDNGKLFSYNCNRRSLYSKEKVSHCHFMCQRCSKIIHINIDSFDFLKKKIDGEIQQFQIDVKGICSNCSKQII